MTKLLHLHALLPLLALCAISVESFLWERPLRYPDINRARTFRELLDIANNEANRADEILQRKEENIKNRLIQISSNIQQRGDDLLNEMKTANPACDKTAEITKLLNETTAALDKEANRDYVTEGRNCLSNIYNRFDANVKKIERYGTRRRGQFMNLRWSKVLLTTTRRKFDLGINRCLRTTADRTALQARFQLSRYRTQFNRCVARNPTTTSTTEITDTTSVGTDTSTETTVVTDSSTGTTTVVTDSTTLTTSTTSSPTDSETSSDPNTTTDSVVTDETTPETTDEQTSPTEGSTSPPTDTPPN